MSVGFIDAWTLHGFRALVLENRELRTVILPELGGKIWSLVAKRHDREMLWHNPRVPPRPAPHGAVYDNWFCGGWDEVFPNDYPVTIDGEPYPDHGEVWSMPMSWQVTERTDAAVTVALEQRGVVIPTRYRKVITLREGEADLHVRYEIANEGRSPLDVHLKLHPALPLAPGARLHLPALPDPDAGEAWFFYGLDLAAGYSAVSYPAEGVGFGVSFDPALFTSVWIFATFAGWRNLRTIILEPCTGYRAHLDEAIRHGTVLTLQPGTTTTTGVTASVLGGADEVAAFEAEGGRGISPTTADWGALP